VFQPVHRVGGLGQRDVGGDGGGEVEAAARGKPDELLDVLGRGAAMVLTTGK
jgi:hypothetical protein